MRKNWPLFRGVVHLLLMKKVHGPEERRRTPVGTALALAALVLLGAPGTVGTVSAQSLDQEHLIPILGVTMGPEPRGTVVYLQVAFEHRHDRTGLAVFFRNSPGRFSRMAQTSIKQGIIRAAQSMGVSCDNWTVVLTVPYRELTIYGESLSAMVSLSVMAMAQGEPIADDLVMTGTVTPEGEIGPVGSVPQKILAAEAAHLRRVLIPEEQDPADSDWQTPFLMQVSPVRSVDQAYEALTEPARLMASY